MPPPQAASTPQPAFVRVLLIEDNPSGTSVVEEALAEAKAPFFLERANCLGQGLEKMGQEGIALVLTDLALPDSAGIETFRSLKTAAGEIPIIVLAGVADEALAVSVVHEGAQDYLARNDITPALLSRAMQYAIRRAESEKALASERNLLRSVVDNQPDSIYVKDVAGRYILDNAAHRRSLGVERMEDVVGKTAYDFFAESIAEKFHADDEQVIRSGQSIVNRQEPSTEDHGGKQWLATSKVPLRDRNGRIIGIVGIGRDITDRRNAEEQLAHYNEQLREKNAQMQDDLTMASEVQQAFLPQQVLTFPKDADPERSTLRFNSLYLPSETVSGDFYQILSLSDTTVGVFICDVMGHGVRAALVTAVQRALIEELIDVAGDPGEFLTQINRSLLSILRRTRTPLFASAFYLVADVKTGEVRFANAGHPKPFHLCREAGTIEMLSVNDERPGPALGVFAESAYATGTAQMKHRDRILLFTDGLFEVDNDAGDYFDQTRLKETLQPRVNLATAELFSETLAEVKAFSATNEFTDDVCLVAMEFFESQP